MALEHQGPTSLALTRQGLPTLEKADKNWRKNIRKGGYVVVDTDGEPEVVIVATGSEVSMAVDAAKQAKKKVRVVSIISRELFLSQDEGFQTSLVPKNAKVVVAEAGICQGWEAFGGREADHHCLHGFGASGPGNAVAKAMGLTVDNLVKKIDG
jgi:transketolase